MESSHLMRNKQLLCEETRRVLRGGGTMLLCDLVLKRDLSVADIYRNRGDLQVLERSFGNAKMETLNFYASTMQTVGFSDLTQIDISREVFPTLEKWQANVESNRGSLTSYLPESEIDNFVHSCRILKRMFAQDVLGYGIVMGTKG
jgi:cyclopropane fatty-acyl-phospholipid synthase-like methyltransferase